MSDRSLSDAVGIDASAVEALGRAGVQSVQQLVDADPDAVAMASGIPVERIRDWQQRARRTGAKARPSPVAKGWLVGAIGVVVAIILGWALIGIGSRKIASAEQTRKAAEAKLDAAVAFAAEDAMTELRQARLSVNNQNWGSAQTMLMKVDGRIRLIQQVAPERRKKDADQVRQLMDDLLEAVSAQSADASQKVDALEAALDKMKETEQ
jgi:uncharacterized membrane protein YccC